MKGIQQSRDAFKKHIDGRPLDQALFNGFVNASLILTQQCNLNCAYCYQPKDFRHDKEMSIEVADKSIMWLAKQYAGSKLTVGLFGGEPFLKFDLLKYLVEKYQQVNFMVTTNGLILSQNADIREWVKAHKNNLVISFSLNALRPIYGIDLLEKAKSVLEVVAHNHGDVHYVMDTPDIDVLSDIKTIVQANVGIVRLSMAKEQDIYLTRKDEFIKKLCEVCDYIYGTEHKKNIKFTYDRATRVNCVVGEPYPNRASSFCGAGFSYLAITPEGDIYPCDYFIVWPEYKIGDINNGFYSTRRIFQCHPEWESSIYKGCTDCPLGDVRLCPNAQCYAENLKYNNDIYKPSRTLCIMREIEVAVYKYVAKLLKGKENEQTDFLRSC